MTDAATEANRASQATDSLVTEKSEEIKSKETLQETEDAKSDRTKPENGTTVEGGKTEEKPSELEEKIIRQVEYYFGDINLVRDKFLQAEIKKDDGWVTLEVMVRFNRLKELSEDQSVISAALKKSTSGLMQVHEESSKIRRDPDRKLPEFSKERKEDLKTRSIYAKHIPVDKTRDEVEAFFRQYGETEFTQMRLDVDRKFKGSVFVIYKDAAAAMKLVNEESTKFPGSEENLIKMMKEDYWKQKSEEKKKSREEELRQKEEAKTQKEKEEEEDFKKKMTKGAILLLTGVPKDTRHEKLKEEFNKYGTCSWVDLYPDKEEARLRFEEESSAVEALEKAKEAGEGTVKLGEIELQGRVLEGEEEEQHWCNFFKNLRANKNRDRTNQRMGRKGHRGRQGHGGGPSRKKARMDDD